LRNLVRTPCARFSHFSDKRAPAGVPVRIGDLANVAPSVMPVYTIVMANGKPAGQRFRAEGYSARDAMIEAGERRLRPILMTAMATVAGMIPLSLAIGAGSQMLQPLAIAVIGGIIASMVLSLIVTPAVHYYLGPRA
jgi:multidrug efflux pump subunit AcrB